MQKQTYKQVDYMRKLVKELGRREDVVSAAYAKAEREGLVSRKSNVHNLTPLEYAVRLYKDGEKKGWF